MIDLQKLFPISAVSKERHLSFNLLSLSDSYISSPENSPIPPLLKGGKGGFFSFSEGLSLNKRTRSCFFTLRLILNMSLNAAVAKALMPHCYLNKNSICLRCSPGKLIG